MTVYGVSFDLGSKQPIVLLRTLEGRVFLPIWIGHAEAAAILVKLQNAVPARPMTHDLLNDVLGQLDAEVVSVAVTEMRENTYYARITLQRNGTEIEVDSRPSDAIALAVRAGAKIYVADEVIEESGVEFEGEVTGDEIAAAAGVSPLAELDPRHVVGHELGAEALGLPPEVGHDVRPHDAFRVAGVVLDVARDHQLAAPLEALDHERREVGTRGVEGRRVAGRTSADDDELTYVVHV